MPVHIISVYRYMLVSSRRMKRNCKRMGHEEQWWKWLDQLEKRKYFLKHLKCVINHNKCLKAYVNNKHEEVDKLNHPFTVNKYEHTGNGCTVFLRAVFVCSIEYLKQRLLQD